MTGDSSWPSSEQDVIDRWKKISSDEIKYLEEIPVHHKPRASSIDHAHGTNTTKWVDIVTVKNLTDTVIQRGRNYVLNTGLGVRYNDRTGDMEFDDPALFVALVESWPYSEMNVHLIEAKQSLSLKAVGQILSYQQFFEPYHSRGGTNVYVSGTEIIYHHDDEFVRKAAESMGIKCTHISSPNQTTL